MFFEQEDFERLNFEVRRFLDKTDLISRLATQAKLYLEFPDVGLMHHAHKAILAAMNPQMLPCGPQGRPYTFIDDHTIEIEPYAGVSIILTCKQRFSVTSGGSIGYRDIAFKTAKLPKDKP